MMPGIDGYETCRRIKTTPTGAQTQIIMVSGHSSREEQLRAYELGADDYLVKPIDIQDLRARVQLHLRMRDALQSVFSIRQEITARNREIQRLAEQRAEDALRIQDVAICTLAKVAESRDQGTGAHVLRVRAYCQLLAEELREKCPTAIRSMHNSWKTSTVRALCTTSARSASRTPSFSSRAG